MTKIKITTLIALSIAGLMHFAFTSAADFQYQDTARDRADAQRIARQSRNLSDINIKHEAGATQNQIEAPSTPTREQNIALSLAEQMGSMAAMHSVCKFKIKGTLPFQEVMQLGLTSFAQLSNLTTDVLQARFENSKNDQMAMQKSTAPKCNVSASHVTQFMDDVQKVIREARKLKQPS